MYAPTGFTGYIFVKIELVPHILDSALSLKPYFPSIFMPVAPLNILVSIIKFSFFYITGGKHLITDNALVSELINSAS